jgi:hypothetical protein
MPSIARPPRHVVSVLLIAMLLLVLPVEPLYAQETAPETLVAVLDDLQSSDDDASAASEDWSDDGAPEGEGTEEPDGLSRPSGRDLVTADDAADTRSDAVTAPFEFSGVGLKGVGPEPVAVRIRSGHGGEWTGWVDVELSDEFDGPDDGQAEDSDSEHWVSQPIWVGLATHLQIDVVGGSLDDVEATVIDTMGHSETMLQRAVRYVTSLGPAPAEAAPGQPSIISRAGWGANESWRRGTPSYRTPVAAVLHHTATTNSYTQAEAAAQVRNMYYWHTNGNGWNDLGYNFVVDRFGRIYEGRAGGVTQGVIGAHAGGWNTGTFGVAIMGHHNQVAPSAASVNAANGLIAWKFGLHGIDPDSRVNLNGHSIRRIEGHRNVRATYIPESSASGFNADCPGSLLYPLMGAMREAASRAVGTSWQPVVGDWNGDGRSTVGWFRDGNWRLRNANSAGQPSLSFTFGARGDRPVVGDWNGDGRTTVGVVRNGEWLLRMSNTAGPPQRSFWFGRGIDLPLVGDWNGDGRDGPGIVRDGEWHLRNTLTGGQGQIRFTFGRVTQGDVPLVGDWNGNGRATPGIVRDGAWHLRNSHTGGEGQIVFTYGRVTQGDVPLVGDWNGNGRPGVGVTRDGAWHLRTSLSGGPASLSFAY